MKHSKSLNLSGILGLVILFVVTSTNKSANAKSLSCQAVNGRADNWIAFVSDTRTAISLFHLGAGTPNVVVKRSPEFTPDNVRGLAVLPEKGLLAFVGDDGESSKIYVYNLNNLDQNTSWLLPGFSSANINMELTWVISPKNETWLIYTSQQNLFAIHIKIEVQDAVWNTPIWKNLKNVRGMPIRLATINTPIGDHFDAHQGIIYKDITNRYSIMLLDWEQHSGDSDLYPKLKGPNPFGDNFQTQTSKTAQWADVAAISPDGKYVAYVSDSSLYIRDLAKDDDKGTVIPDVHPMERTNENIQLVWSSDNNSLLYSNQGHFYVVQPGSQAPCALDDNVIDKEPVWVPDSAIPQNWCQP